MATRAGGAELDVDVARIADRTVPGIFFRQADRRRDAVLMRHFDGSRWIAVTWDEMADLTLRVAAGLVAAGVEPGDHVILIAENRIEWLYCDLGIQAAGAITVPVYPSSSPQTVKVIAANSEAVLAIAGSPRLAAKVEVTGPLHQVVEMDSELAEWTAAAPAADAMAEIGRRLAAVQPDDVATVIYTSGTTGEPKGVVLAQRNLADMAKIASDLFGITAEDVTLSFLPYSHVLERANSILVGLVSGASGWMSRGMDHLADDLAEAQPTVMVGVPRMYEKMHAVVMSRVREAPPIRQALFRWAMGVGRARHLGGGGPLAGVQYPLADRLVLKPLRQRLTGGRLKYFVSGGAPLNEEVEAFFWSLGVKILQGWGMTETTSGATSNTERQHRFTTVGRPFPGVEILIAEDGEILAKGPGNMLGYHRNPEATAEILVDGWIRTGDIGEVDAEGFLKITDRKKDLIKTAGGKFVAPQQLEAALQNDPTIEKVVVIGDNRPYVTALIIPDWQGLKSVENVAGDPAQLVDDDRVKAIYQRRVDQLNSGLGSWEQIKYFTLLPDDFTEEAGQLTPTLKVKRRVIHEQHKHHIEAMYAGKQRPQGATGH